MIGLIGEGGAIGVFHGAVGVGGFQAGPPPAPSLARRRVIVWIIPFGLPMRVMQTNAAALVIPATAMTQASQLCPGWCNRAELDEL